MDINQITIDAYNYLSSLDKNTLCEKDLKFINDLEVTLKFFKII